MQRIQAAMEYLMTYGWAILILVVVLVALYELHVFSPVAQSQCIFEAGFACSSVTMSQNGLITARIIQTTETPINITAYGCNASRGLSSLIINTPYNPPSNQVTVLVGQNFTFTTPCYVGGSQFSGSVGQTYVGFIVLNYTEQYTGLPHTIYGSVIVQVG